VSRKTKIIAGVVAAVVVVAGVVAYTQIGGGTSTTNNEVIILNTVQRRTLQSSVALTGTLARKQLRNITAATEGLVSAVYATADSTTQAGQPMFALDGRDAIAETGTVPFFRSLGPGDEGDDVLQLKQILAAAGDDPGPMTPLFTEQTQFALAQWQAQHHYPNATPASPQSVTVSLQEGTGYKLGDQVSAGLIIGPPAQTVSRTSAHGTAEATLTDVQPDVTPNLTIQSVADDVAQGAAATFVITASAAPAADITVNLSSGGTATSDDVVTPPTSVVLPMNQTSVTVSVQTRVNEVVEANPTITMAIIAGSGYTVGTPASAQTTIKDDNVPTLQIGGGSTVSPGGTATLTITASVAPLQDTQVELDVAGSALAGTDYDPVDPVVTLPAGSTSASVTIDTLDTKVIQPDKYIVVSIAPSPTSYGVGPLGAAVVTISGSAALPTVTLSSATTYLEKGEPYAATISLSEALDTPLTIDLAYGGSAQQGADYTLPGGNIVVPAGQTSLPVTFPTVTDNVVEPDRTLTVSLVGNPAYLLGSQSSVSVTITSSVLPELDVSVDTSTVDQGGAASFVITADQPVVKNTSVNFSVLGTAQPGQDYEPLVGAALLPAGQSQVTVVLQTLRTDVTFEPTDMIVGQWPTRVGQVFVKAGDPATPGEAILSLTEPDLTVTLQASAANATLLKVGQPCTVQISGANTTASGTITELDSTPTTVSSSTPGAGSQQVYEGRIEVSGLTGADGSAVSINVVDQQVDDALTVPIAAVKQDGVGADVVRVLDRKTGVVTEERVTTGLTEGSYIQVTKGARLGQTVIVEVDQPQ
jgi:multidrug efflux pump subunit AcrA (membrane-fusion protein)